MRIVGVSPYGIYPPISGTHKRVYYLNLFAAKNGHEVTIFSQSVRPFEKKELLKRGFGTWRINIEENYVEHRWVNPISLATSWFFYKLGLQPPILTGTILKTLKPKALRELLSDADVVKVEFPWQTSAVISLLPRDTPVVTVQHNVEFDLIRQMILQKSSYKKRVYSRILDTVFTIEREALISSHHIITVSEDDKDRLHELYGIPKHNISTIPNGVCIEEYAPPSEEEKIKLKRELGLEGKITLLFVGFNYYPNIIAAESLMKLAKKMPSNCIILIVGSVGESLNSPIPDNVIITGYVEDIKPYFKVADIALNPMSIGGGSNIKMFEYMAAGLPVITTPLGARGIPEAKNYKHLIVAELEEFAERIKELMNNPDLREAIGRNARDLITREYSWRTLAEKELEILKKFQEGSGVT